MKQKYYTVRQEYDDDDYVTHDRAVWTFKTQGAAYGFINYIEQNDECASGLYVEEWNEAEDG